MAIVVSSTDYNRQRPDLIIMAVTSQMKPAASFGEVLITQWKQAGLIKPPVIKPICTTVEKGIVLKKLGLLTQQDQQSLRAAFQTILG